MRPLLFAGRTMRPGLLLTGRRTSLLKEHKDINDNRVIDNNQQNNVTEKKELDKMNKAVCLTQS